jgi:hypothetical protein
MSTMTFKAGPRTAVLRKETEINKVEAVNLTTALILRVRAKLSQISELLAIASSFFNLRCRLRLPIYL